jgi:hypothetical protein
MLCAGMCLPRLSCTPPAAMRQPNCHTRVLNTVPHSPPPPVLHHICTVKRTKVCPAQVAAQEWQSQQRAPKTPHEAQNHTSRKEEKGQNPSYTDQNPTHIRPHRHNKQKPARTPPNTHPAPHNPLECAGAAASTQLSKPSGPHPPTWALPMLPDHTGCPHMPAAHACRLPAAAGDCAAAEGMLLPLVRIASGGVAMHGRVPLQHPAASPPEAQGEGAGEGRGSLSLRLGSGMRFGSALHTQHINSDSSSMRALLGTQDVRVEVRGWGVSGQTVCCSTV